MQKYYSSIINFIDKLKLMKRVFLLICIVMLMIYLKEDIFHDCLIKLLRMTLNLLHGCDVFLVILGYHTATLKQ